MAKTYEIVSAISGSRCRHSIAPRLFAHLGPETPFSSFPQLLHPSLRVGEETISDEFWNGFRKVQGSAQSEFLTHPAKHRGGLRESLPGKDIKVFVDGLQTRIAAVTGFFIPAGAGDGCGRLPRLQVGLSLPALPLRDYLVAGGGSPHHFAIGTVIARRKDPPMFTDGPGN